MAVDSTRSNQKFAGTYRKLLDTLERGEEQCSPDRLQTLLGEKCNNLALGLDVFTQPSSQSRSKVTTSGTSVSVEGKTINLDQAEKDFVCKLSDFLNLNELQCVSLWEAFRNDNGIKRDATEQYKMDEDLDLLMRVTAYYHDDRIALLQCIASLLRISYIESHPYNHIANDNVETIQNNVKNGKTFIDRLLAQLSALVRTQVPSQFYTFTSWAIIWAKQNLKEQKALLEIIFLVHLKTLCPASLALSLLQEFEASSFGMRQEFGYVLDKEGDVLRSEVSNLCILVAVQSLNLARLRSVDVLQQQAEDNDVLDSPDTIVKINEVLAFLGESSEHSVILLAWSYFLGCMDYILEDQTYPTRYANVRKLLDGQLDVTTASLLASRPATRGISLDQHVNNRTPSIKQVRQMYRLYAGRALKLDVFDHLANILQSSICDEDDAENYQYRCVLRELLNGFLSTTRPAFLPPNSYSSLVDCTCLLFENEPDLCAQFWTEDFGKEGLSSLLFTVSNRFPVNFLDFTRLLSSLSGADDDTELSAESAKRVFQYLQSLSTLTVPVKSTVSLALSEEGEAIVALPEQPVRITVDYPLLKGVAIPAGLRGALVSASEDTRVVQWSINSSAWHFLVAVLAGFCKRDSSPAGLDVERLEEQLSGQDIEVVHSILNLIRKLLRANRALATELVQHVDAICGKSSATSVPSSQRVLISLLRDTLIHCSLIHPLPINTITSTLQCLTALLPFYREDIWELLQTAPILPRSNANHQISSRYAPLSTSVNPLSQIHNIVAKVECVTGQYTLLLAFLDLVTALVRDIQRGWWVGDQEEASRQHQVEVLYLCLHYLMLDVYPSYSGWRYKKLSERFTIGSKVLTIFIEVVRYFKDSASQPTGKLSLSGLRDGIMNNFLYDGGAYHISPLLNTVSDGATIANNLYHTGRTKEASRAEKLTELTFVFIKLLLKRRVEVIAEKPASRESTLERLMLEQATGTNRPDFLLRIMKHISYQHNTILRILATNIATLLVRIVSAWKTVPNLVQYLGSSDQAQEIIRSYLEIAQDHSQSERLLASVWNMLTEFLKTQPSLAILFLECGDYIMPSPKSAVKLLQEEKKSANTGAGSGAVPNTESAVRAAVDILTHWQMLSVDKPTALSNILRFLSTFWETAFDHYAIVQRTRSDNALWHALEEILLNPSDVEVPVSMDLDSEDLGLAVDRYDNKEPMDPQTSSRSKKVRRLCCSNISKASVMRIMSYEVHLTAGSDIAAGRASTSKVSDKLPAGLKSLLSKISEPSKMSFVRNAFIRNSFDSEITSTTQQNAQTLLGIIGVTDDTQLLCKLGPVGSGDDDTEGEDRQYGDSYLYDYRIAESRIRSLYEDIAKKYNVTDIEDVIVTPEVLAVQEVKKASVRFLTDIRFANHNVSIVDSEIVLLKSFKTFMEVCSGHVGDFMWSCKPSDAVLFDFLMGVIQQAAVDKREDGVALTVYSILIDFIRSLTEDWIHSNRSVLLGNDKNLKRQYSEKAFTLLVKFSELLKRENFCVMGSVFNRSGVSFHRPLLEATMLTLHTLRGVYGKKTELMMNIDSTGLIECISHLLDVTCESFHVLVLKAAAYSTATDAAGEAMAEECMKDVTVTIGLLEEMINPIYMLPHTIWLTTFSRHETLAALLKLLYGGIQIVVSEVQSRASQANAHGFDISPYAETALYFLIALSNIPAAADALVQNGLFDMFSNNALTSVAQHGQLELFIRFGDGTNTGPPYVERNPLHLIWCQMMAVINNLVRTLGNSDKVLGSAVVFLQIYGPQIDKAFANANGGNDPILGLTPSESLSSALLEEIERVSMIMFGLAKHMNRTVHYASNVFVCYKDYTLPLLQRYLYFFTHPAHMQAQLYPIDNVEEQLAHTFNDTNGQKTSQLMQQTIHKIVRVMRNILSTMVLLTNAVDMLNKPESAWPFGNAIICPTLHVAVGEPASFGTLIECMNSGITMMKQWQAQDTNAAIIRNMQDVIEGCLCLLTTQAMLWMAKPNLEEDARQELAADNVKDIIEILNKVEGLLKKSSTQ
ncbi:hypothetical protein EC973_004966 [Apophysomyces ossiformis]|uniref:Nucleoporin NUP188 n=1 Tax=Apophysomyces ossiformis TaxID=679940 RepID=A0A8H7BPK9_9FUNG|nr:hypothetical protein EC973_004966 [Apophysomyces ossiformis]